MQGLQRDLGGASIDLLWITHQHSDHTGGAPDVLGTFVVTEYVDNGRDLDKATVKRTRDAAHSRGARVTVVDPEHPDVPLKSGTTTLEAVVPAAWASGCGSRPNECSIGLRVELCSSSILFVGDVEAGAEVALGQIEPATLLQIGHHGSDTSSSAAFLQIVRPRYAVISAGRPDVGLNRTYCHPRGAVVARVTDVLGGAGSGTIRSFDAAVGCTASDAAAHWVEVPASDYLWATQRDGDVTLVTHGDGTFISE
jgi:competence protein ComEC